MSTDIANKDEAIKCRQIAKKALAEGDYAKAEKFALKAKRLYTMDEVRIRMSGRVAFTLLGQSIYPQIMCTSSHTPCRLTSSFPKSGMQSMHQRLRAKPRPRALANKTMHMGVRAKRQLGLGPATGRARSMRASRQAAQQLAQG